MLARMWSKGSPHALLVGMQIGAAIVEKSMELTQQVINGIALWPSDSNSENISKETQTLIRKNICIPLFITALFTTAKIWKQPSAHE